MKAIVKARPGRGFLLEERPKPTLGERDVLIQTVKTSLCGTDIHIDNWDEWAQKNVPLGTIVGHEFVGKIVTLGSHVQGPFKVGQRVCGEGHITCGECQNCLAGRRHLCSHTQGIGVHRDGCFADFLCLPAENLFPIPDTISDDVASIFDPFGNAVHAALSFPLIGESVLITGAGPIGMMAAAIARHAGASRVVVSDPNPNRRKLALLMGATEVVDAGKEKGPFNVGLEMSGQPAALNAMLEAIQPGGKIALLGILPSKTTIDWDNVIFKMVEIKGIYGRKIFDTWHQMLHLIEGGLNLEPVITHHFPALDYEKAFEELHRGNCGKIILNWD